MPQITAIRTVMGQNRMTISVVFFIVLDVAGMGMRSINNNGMKTRTQLSRTKRPQ
jgi:hypothetical protein